MGSNQEKVTGFREEFWGIINFGTKLLQISRSTPYLTAALIGHKQVSLPPYLVNAIPHATWSIHGVLVILIQAHGLLNAHLGLHLIYDSLSDVLTHLV